MNAKEEGRHGLAHLTQLLASRKDGRYQRCAFTKSFIFHMSDHDLQHSAQNNTLHSLLLIDLCSAPTCTPQMKSPLQTALLAEQEL